MGRRTKEKIEPVKTVIEYPDGVVEYRTDYGKEGTTVVRVIPAADQSPEAKALGDRRIQAVLRSVMESQARRREAEAAAAAGT